MKAAGTTRALNRYQFSDEHPAGGQNLYRLKMIDLDNTFAYSKVEALTFDKGISIYPNPVSNMLHVQ